MTDPLVLLTPWVRPMTQAASVCQAYGYGIVTWPSGRRTLEQYAATAVITDLERSRAGGRRRDVLACPIGNALAATKIENLLRSLNDWRARKHPAGWFIRVHRGRRKARAVRAVAWLHPESYVGPAPQRGGVLA